MSNVVIPLWPGLPPGSEEWTHREADGAFGAGRVPRNVVHPRITVVPSAPGVATGAAVVIVPGGGFQMLCTQHEGFQLAAWLATRGVTSFLLEYRLIDTGPTDEHFDLSLQEMMTGLMALAATESPVWPPAERDPAVESALADGRQAMRVVREHADELGVDPARVAMIGFSAGASVAMHAAIATDPAERPDLVALIYGGRLEGVVPDDAPPAFWLVASNDFMREGMLDAHRAWLAARRPAELHVFEHGGHGFGMHEQGLPVNRWPELWWAWLEAHEFRAARAADHQTR